MMMMLADLEHWHPTVYDSILVVDKTWNKNEKIEKPIKSRDHVVVACHLFWSIRRFQVVTTVFYCIRVGCLDVL